MIIQIEPWIDNKELEQLKRVVESTYVTEHNLTKEFEEKIKKLTGAKHAISITNGTLALFCCLKALGIGHGDEVIVPDMTFIATSNAVIMAGAKPIFCDVTKDNFCLDVESAKSVLTNNTKAIMPVHLYGQSANMNKILSFAKENKIFVIEDAAQGVGVKWNNKHVGTFGDCGILSFYGNKTVTCGEGGIILTDNDDIAKKCYRLKNHGRDKKGIFIHEHIGYNFCFTEMQAAVGIAQLTKLKKIISLKQKIYNNYKSSLNELKGIQFIPVGSEISPVHWFTSVLTEKKEELQKYLAKNNIQTRMFFYPLHRQPCYSCMDIKNNFPVSNNAFKTGISLPSAYSLTKNQQDKVIKCIKDFFKK